MTYDDSYGEFFHRMAQQRAREEDGEEIEDDADEHVPFYDDSYVEFFQCMEQQREDESSSDQDAEKE